MSEPSEQSGPSRQSGAIRTVVLLEVSERIATVTLNRPEARNALSGEVLRLLSQHLKEADGRDDVDVIILTGADPAFCAGLDLRELGDTVASVTAATAPTAPPTRTACVARSRRSTSR